MTEALEGRVIIIEHPALYETHVLAKVVNLTEKTMMVQYWNPRDGWSERPSRRNKAPAIADLGSADAIDAQSLKKAFDRIQSFRSDRTERHKAASLAYIRNVQSLGECE